MKELILVKYGEMALKGLNKKTFEDKDGYSVYCYYYSQGLFHYEDELKAPSDSLYAYLLAYRTDRFDIYYFKEKSVCQTTYNKLEDKEHYHLLGDYRIIKTEADYSFLS